MNKGIVYDIPLRPDFMAQLVVPRDLTIAEARKLASTLLTVCIDVTPGDIAQITNLAEAAFDVSSSIAAAIIRKHLSEGGALRFASDSNETKEEAD